MSHPWTPERIRQRGLYFQSTKDQEIADQAEEIASIEGDFTLLGEPVTFLRYILPDGRIFREEFSGEGLTLRLAEESLIETAA